LKLSGVGFDTSTWANFKKDVTVGGSLSANIAHLTELSSTTLNVDKLVPHGTHISATSMMVDYISVGRLEGFTTNNVQVKVQEGWDAIETNVCTPRFTAYNDTIYPTTTITDFTTAVEHLVVINVSAAGYESYGEFEVYSIKNSTDTKLGGLKIGNLGLVSNYALEHSEKPGLMINNEQTVSLVVPASCAFKITSLSGFYEAASDSNIRISTTVFQRKYADIFFENEEFTISKLTINGPLTSTSAIASPLLCTTNIDIINTPLSNSVHMNSIVLSAGSVSVEAANVLRIKINGTQYFLKLYS